MYGRAAPGASEGVGEMAVSSQGPKKSQIHDWYLMVCDELTLISRRKGIRDQYAAIKDHLETEKERLAALYYGRTWPIRSD